MEGLVNAFGLDWKIFLSEVVNFREANKQASKTIAASVEKGKEREMAIITDANIKGESLFVTAKEKGEAAKQSIIDSSKDDIAKMIVLGAEKILAQK